MNLDLRELPVVYINMDKDVEKRKRIENYIDTIGFKNKIRVVGVQHMEGPRAGCALAQYNALYEIDPPFIILEDDATPFSFDPIKYSVFASAPLTFLTFKVPSSSSVNSKTLTSSAITELVRRKNEINNLKIFFT